MKHERFTDFLWLQLKPIVQKIFEHPFIKGLSDGTLKESAFRHYVVQDTLYLKDFGRALAVLASKALTDKDMLLFAEHARTTVLVEQSLHHLFFADWKISPKELQHKQQAPVCLLYTSYLLRTVNGSPFHEGLGALLPCYWIYQVVGEELLKRPSPNAIYQRWIDTYGGENFQQVVAAVLDVVDRVSTGLSPTQRQAMVDRALTSAQLEYMFWDMGYREEQWPF